MRAAPPRVPLVLGVTLLASTMLACSASHRQATDGSPPAPDAGSCSDADGDGETDAACGGTDCRDDDPAVGSGADERCNGMDDDCDGSVDEGLGCSDVLEVAGACARLRDGSVRCFHPFLDSEEPTHRIEGIDDAIALSDSGCAVLGDGTVSCWCVHYADPLIHRPPGCVPFQAEPVPGLTDIVRFAGYPEHFACGIRRDATLWCLGTNHHGQLGRGVFSDDRDEIFAPGPVPGLENVREVAVSTRTACALTEAGRIACWGDNSSGFLGPDVDRAAEPTWIPTIAGARTLAGSLGRACAAGEQGVQCWGVDDDGLVTGQNPPVAGVVYPPELLSTNPDVVSLTIGHRRGILATDSGRLLEWGFLPAGRPGIGPPVGRSPPEGVDQVSSAGALACALDLETGLYCSVRGVPDRSTAYLPIDLDR